MKAMKAAPTSPAKKSKPPPAFAILRKDRDVYRYPCVHHKHCRCPDWKRREALRVKIYYHWSTRAKFETLPIHNGELLQ